MAEMKHYTTAREDRISLAFQIIYGFGALVYKLLAATIDGMATVLNFSQVIYPVLESAQHQYMKSIGVRCGRQLI